jgi:hypothetical protein
MTSCRLSTFTLTMALAAATGLGALAGCAGQGDIDRTQPDKVRKAIFYDATTGQPKTYYYRQTYVDVPPTSAWAFEGTQGSMLKVKFVIEENFLKGYRSYDYAPGSENPFTGGSNNMDTPMLVYAIKSHFDVKREYNPGTGEQTNVISENTTDRPWDQREYMRVDWSVNLADFDLQALMFDPTTQFLPVLNAVQPSSVTETVMSDPAFQNRPIMTDDYIDFVQYQTKTIDLNACLQLYPGIDDGSPWDCGPAKLGIRHSFLPVKPSSYQPLEYPDTYPILDANGNPFNILPNGYPCTPETFQLAGGQYSGSDCQPASVDGFKKFGFFRTVVQTYNRNYAATEDGRKYYANRWNIWQDKDTSGNSLINADGSVRQVPVNELVPKPIVYYTNIEFPDNDATTDAPDGVLFKEAQEVTADWSSALKKTVAAMRLAAPDPNAVIQPANIDQQAASVPEMVVLHKNDCNVKEVQGVLADSQNAAIAATVKAATGVDASSLDKTKLAQVCSILEAQGAALTIKDDKGNTTTTKFAWQRNGDLRYSFFYWVDRPEPTMPLGYGPASADPQTGEIISASLYNYGAALDSYSQTSADMVELLNNQISVDDLLSGKTIADVLKQTAASHASRDALPLTAAAKANALAHLPSATVTGTPRLIPVPGGQPVSKMSLIKGTKVEQMMMTPDILALKLPNSKPGDQLSPDELAQASPANWLTPDAQSQRQKAMQTLSMNGCVYMGEFADDAILGLALNLKGKGLTGTNLWTEIRRMIFRGLADHEMGHTMGLRHNFSGSSDALNYKDDFWAIHENTNLSPDQKDQQSMSEFRYSTVMDYGSRFNSDVRGLGKYDFAAIRFGYGNLVDVMPNAMNSAGQTEAGLQLQNDILFQDYTKLPTLVGGMANLKDGGVQPYSAIRSQLQDAYTNVAKNPNKPQGGFFITKERPYKFCSDEYIGNLDCKQWDFGANQQEIVNDSIDRFHNYFVFNAFKRGRLNWTIDGYLNRLLQRYFIRYIEAFQFYYFYGPVFQGTDLGDDLLKASMNSLNALGEVLETPEPGQHCATKDNPNVLVLPDPTGPNSCMTTGTKMNIQIPDGKPYYINFSDDYYYRITRAGSLYEKLGALIALTSTAAHFYRVDTFADANQYAINFYSVFKDEMLNLLSGVIRNDPTTYGGYVPTTGSATGLYQPTPVVDLTRYGQANPPMPEYMKPGNQRVDTPVNKTIQYFAIGLALANLDTSWDATLDISNYLAVSIKGSKDDMTYNLPPSQVVEYTHPQTGITYRAPLVATDISGTVNVAGGIGATTIKELIALTGVEGTPGTIDRKYGADSAGNPLPDWQTAKANLQAAKDAVANNTDTSATTTTKLQAAFQEANAIYQYVDQSLVAYRVEGLDDIRSFRQVFGY